MNLLVVGGGGREHAIIKKVKENPAVETVYALPGNGGIAADAVCVPEIGAKDIGAMATVLNGKVDKIILTGGIAYSKVTCEDLKKRVGWIADFVIYPGEDELLALAQGGLRVMKGEEEAKAY